MDALVQCFSVLFGTEKQPFFDWMRIAMTSQDVSKRKICGKFAKIAEFAWFCDKFRESQNPGGTVRRSLNRADSEKELRASLLLTSISLCLTAAAHASSNAHTIQEYLDHGQSERGPPFTISDWFRPLSLTCLLLNSRETFWVAETFVFFLEWLDAPVRPQIFFCRTLEKLGRTLEPCVVLET